MSLLSCAGSVALAAQVTSVKADKGIVDIDAGTNMGLDTGSNVCIISGAKKVCGKVIKAVKDKARIQVAKERAGSIKVGDRADFAGTAATKTASSKKPATEAYAGYVITLLGPASFEKLSYIKQGSAGTRSTIWKSDGSSSASYFGLAAGALFGLGTGWGIDAGLRFRTLRGIETIDDYAIGSPAKYSTTTITGSAIGFWASYVKQLDINQSMHLNLGGGFDLDRSTITVDAVQQEDGKDTKNDIAKATSSINVVSLRLGPQAVFNIGNFGIYGGPNVLLPLFLLGSAISGSVSDESINDTSVDPNVDFKTSLNHKKGGFGLELMIGGGMKF